MSADWDAQSSEGCYTLVSERHGRQLRKRAEGTTDATSRRPHSFAAVRSHIPGLYISMLRLLSSIGLLKAVHFHRGQKVVHALQLRPHSKSRHHYLNSSFPTSLETHSAPNERRERKTLAPSSAPATAFVCTVTCLLLLQRLSLARLVLSVPSTWSLATSWGGRRSCSVYTRRCYSPPPPRHHNGSCPLRDAEPPPSNTFSSRPPRLSSLLLFTHSAPLLPHQYASVATFFVAFRR